MSTARSRSAAAKKAARTRARNAKKRSTAAKKAARTRKRKGTKKKSAKKPAKKSRSRQSRSEKAAFANMCSSGTLYRKSGGKRKRSAGYDC